MISRGKRLGFVMSAKEDDSMPGRQAVLVDGCSHFMVATFKTGADWAKTFFCAAYVRFKA